MILRDLTVNRATNKGRKNGRENRKTGEKTAANISIGRRLQRYIILAYIEIDTAGKAMETVANATGQQANI